jgi:hypothetical protein
MADVPTLNRDEPKTVHDILWSWSLGHISKAAAISMMELDDEIELQEAALANDVPLPGEASARDVEQAEEFVATIPCQATAARTLDARLQEMAEMYEPEELELSGGLAEVDEMNGVVTNTSAGPGIGSP